MARITLQSPGLPVANFAVAGALITVAGVSVDCAALQADTPQTVEIRHNADGPGIGGEGAYLAHIHIPAKAYTETESSTEVDDNGNPVIVRAALPLDVNAIAVTLWPTV
ncbi:MAG: hypothetical protein WAO76_10865 [Georgfuchsia sp.]